MKWDAKMKEHFFRKRNIWIEVDGEKEVLKKIIIEEEI